MVRPAPRARVDDHGDGADRARPQPHLRHPAGPAGAAEVRPRRRAHPVLALPVGLGFLLLVAGGAFADAMVTEYGWSADAADTWNVARWPVGVALMVVTIAVLLDHAPRRRQPGLSWLAAGPPSRCCSPSSAPGSSRSTCRESASFGNVYGPLAGIMALLIWALLSSIALFYGGARVRPARGLPRRKARAGGRRPRPPAERHRRLAGCAVRPTAPGWGHGVHPSRPHRPARQPAVPRHDELRPPDHEDDAFAIMDRAHEQGINFFDTANVYGCGVENQRPHRADRRQLVRPGRRPAGADRPRDQGLRRDGRAGPTTTSSPRSTSAAPRRVACSRLQTDHIDLYQLHHVDLDTPWEEIWQAMERLVAQGKILYVGGVQLRRLAHRPGQRGGRPRGTSYGPGQRAVDLQPAHPRRRAGGAPGRAGTTGSASSRGPRCTAACSAACCARSGRASGAPAAGPRRRSRSTATQIQAYEDLLRRARRRARRRRRWPGCSRRPAVTAPIIGPRTQEQLDGPLRALERRAGRGALPRLDEIFPGSRHRAGALRLVSAAGLSGRLPSLGA